MTDAQDKILVSAILRIYLNPQIMQEGEDSYKFSESGLYYVPDATTQSEFIEYVRGLPLIPKPEAFGMHANCNITYAESMASALLENILSMAPRASGGAGKSREDQIDELATDLIQKTPKLFDIEMMEEQFPTSYHESTNTVIKQEALKYNRLIAVMHKSLPVLRKALKGLVAMNSELVSMGESMFNNFVPDPFQAPPAGCGFLSLMPLSFWTRDLMLRIGFIQNWIDLKKPPIFWLSGLFFPQAFFTGSLQNYARKNHVAIDRCSFGFEVKDDIHEPENVKEGPEKGVYVYGMSLESGRWDNNMHSLVTSIPKELYSKMPPILLVPMVDRKLPQGCYECPMYKTLARRGVLSTTGHSTNFVLNVSLNSLEDPTRWTVSGLAMFLALKTC